MVTELRLEEVRDFCIGHFPSARPFNARVPRDSVDHALPVLEKIAIADNRPLDRARLAFGVEHVPQPNQEGLFRLETISRRQRERDLRWMPDGQNRDRLDSDRLKIPEPEGNESADPGILHHEQRRGIKLLFEQATKLVP